MEKALCGELTPSRVPPAPVSLPLCCLLPPRAPVLAEAENFRSPQTWLYRDMRLPQLGSVVLWLRVFTQSSFHTEQALWNLQDMFKTIWRFDLNSIAEYGGRVGGATLWGHIKTYHWGCQICQGYDAFSSLIFMFEYSSSFQTHRICCKQYLDFDLNSFWVYGVLGGGAGGANTVPTDPWLTQPEIFHRHGYIRIWDFHNLAQ